MKLRTCVAQDGRFRVGIHRPEFRVENLREMDYPGVLGKLADGTLVDNQANFPPGPVHEPGADLIYEIANPFPFRGTTYINSAWADTHAGRPETIGVALPGPCSLFQALEQWDPGLTANDKARMVALLPQPLCLSLAQASTDPEELIALAKMACTILFENDTDIPLGIGFKQKKGGGITPEIHHPELFEVLVNNPHLPDGYKQALVLKPGVQGKSEIMGEFRSKETHVFEYLRRNSYIPWGHFAANMADDTIRYRAKELSAQDMTGLRHLYYQRVYVRVAQQLDIPLPGSGRCLSQDELETLRITLVQALNSSQGKPLSFNRSLWGWNFGFGFAQSGHRLHASHQMIHHQNALVPEKIRDHQGNPYDCFACGDLVEDFIIDFRESTGKCFFDLYLAAIRNNQRTDGKALGPSSLIVHEDDQVILFAPKAQVSEWELQLMTQKSCSHILSADTGLRQALDSAMLLALQTLETLGAQMVSAIEFSGRFDRPGTGQHLIYSFVPRLPYAPGTFSEAQLRWISGCYPEDFAQACRRAIDRER